MTDCTAYVPRAETSTAPSCGNWTGIAGGAAGCITRMPGVLLVSVPKRGIGGATGVWGGYGPPWGTTPEEGSDG